MSLLVWVVHFHSFLYPTSVYKHYIRHFVRIVWCVGYTSGTLSGTYFYIFRQDNPSWAKDDGSIKPKRESFVSSYFYNLGDDPLITGYQKNARRIKSGARPSSAKGALQSNETYPNRITFREIKEYVDTKQKDGNVLITICDQGYLSVFRLFYRINKLYKYPNFIVFVMDKNGYEVSVSKSSYL